MIPLSDEEEDQGYFYGPPDEECRVVALDRRWYMVAVLGTSLSVLSLLSNLLIAIVLLRSRHSHFFFLAILAISDAFLSLMYGPVIAMEVIKDRLQMIWLSRAYWSYITPALSLCHTSMTFSTYLIALATIERFLITEKSAFLDKFRNNRKKLAAFTFLAALVLRGTIFFEVSMEKNGNCTGLTEYTIAMTELASESWIYGTIFKFYIRNILTILVPFTLLAYLNVRIVRTLRGQQRAAAMFRFATSKHKLKVRSATRLMVLIVCSYLMANFLNVIVTAWEYVHFESTQDENAYVIYETITDCISVMYIFVCATRLFVYVSCNEEIRNDVVQFINCLWHFCDRNQESPNSGKRQNMRTGGTELDSVAVHIARQLLVQDVNPDKKSCMEEGDEEEDIDCVDDSDGIKPILSGEVYADEAVRLRNEITDKAVRLRNEITDKAVRLRNEITDKAVRLRNEITDKAVRLRNDINDKAVRLRNEITMC